MAEPRLLDDQLCVAVYNANKRFNRFYMETLKPYNLTFPQYIALCALWENDKQTVNEIGEKLSLDSGTLTPLLRRLEQNGWVKRTRSKSDERQVIVRLSTKAKEQRDEIYQHVTDCQDLLAYDDVTYADSRSAVKDLSNRLASVDEHDLSSLA
ncbi:MarR family winged helix-turn-helix transcriptional regulator [Furfurilactobacillus siliginis]|nr:MarR family transcriptional regulator [Furfurilactobacillus siliginis]GEK29147.1 MarR family transcriptional regulator [Furfurilactobacillus siliginis]